eukprot:Plantae.Rhodophyta-Purpureofilum_apyrenoidigerum.ctg24769.p1 GENE.Plantae.Rhodophyta-Purpureofilum_apyrenoidigerum.ctg24769~~Plantae.Rhodophyta-Purpureofilum_apyrenoidigerum.ctg24769.p1  ORF type:complete len:155 (-),score=28.13 Plantae.Rhodophyta-Purpureofilum_apyrenoidigerum.ctg24769:200-619(-)
MSAVESGEATEMETTMAQASEEDGDCHIRFLLVNGKEFRMEFPANTAVKAVKSAIVKSRPQALLDSATETDNPAPEKTDDVRILYLGRFLEDGKTLDEYSFAVGESNPTAVHISLKPSTSAIDSQRDRKGKKSQCCVVQ